MELELSQSRPQSSFPLTSGRKTRALGAILVPRGRAPFGQHQESRPLAKSNTGSPRFTDFPSLCACSESSVTNLIGSGLNLLCLLRHSKTECRWTRLEVAILGADQKERGLWGRECLGASISGMRLRCRLRSETGRAEFGYFLCYFKMVAPRALVFRPLVKVNEDSGNEIGTSL